MVRPSGAPPGARVVPLRYLQQQTLEELERKAAQVHKDRELAAAEERATVTRAQVGVVRKESTRVQGKELRSSENPSRADTMQDSKAPLPQQATSTRQAGAFHVSHTSNTISPAVFDGSFKEGEGDSRT